MNNEAEAVTLNDREPENVEERKLVEFTDFLKLPWDKRPFISIGGFENELEILMWTNDNHLTTFQMNDFHKALGYGSLRWKSIFSWLTKYIDRCLGTIKVAGGEVIAPWNPETVSDLVYELKDVNAHYPAATSKNLGEKIHFTELAQDGSPSSRFEKVWGSTYVQADPSLDTDKLKAVKADGAGGRTLNADGTVTV